MMLNIKKLAVLIVLLPLKLFSQQDSVLSLNEILQRINNNNLLLQSYGLRAKGFEHSADAATAWMPPMIGAGTFMTPYPGQMKMQPSDAGSLMFRFEQEIPNPLRLRARSRYIASQGNIELAQREVTYNDLRARARGLYASWLVSTKRIKVLQHNIEVLEMLKKIEEVRYPYNQSQLSSIFQANARIEENRNMTRMQEGEISRARAQLNGLMNAPGNSTFTIDTSERYLFTPSLFDTASLALVRKDVLRMNQSIRSMELNIGSMLQQRRPDFRIQYDHMYPRDAMMPNSFSAMGMITIPIAPWSSKMYKSEIKAMELNIQAMQKERDAMLQETQGMVYGMQREIAAMQKRIQSMENTVIPALHSALDASLLTYRENKTQMTLVIVNWDALNMMQMDLLNERLRLYQMIVDYEKEIYR